MIIFGTKTSVSPRDTGEFACPRCQSIQPYQRFVSRRWFTLYFIPVIPLGTVGEIVGCLGCGSRYDPQVLADSQATRPTIASTEKGPAGAISPLASSPLAPAPTSALAITSLVFALISPAVLCMCGLSLLTSLVAIVTGHISLARIKGSAGQLAGRGLAMAGTIVGYVMFAISLLAVAALLPGFLEGWRNAERQHVTADPSPASERSDRLLAAEMNVMTSSTDGAATGNSPAARALAEEYSASMKQMREILFTADEDRTISLTKGEFVTHCELHDDRCAFIVHVPAYRKFEDDAKETLAEIAWSVAQSTVETTLKPGDSLAVGLRGTILYGAVLAGQVAEDDDRRDDYEQGKRDDLLAFFTPPNVDTTDAIPPMESDRNRPETASEVNDELTAKTTDDIEPPVERGPPSSPIPARQSPITRELVLGPVIPGMEVPDHFADNRPPRGPVAGWPSEPRPTAPTIEPEPKNNVPTSKELVQQFPEMGWSVESLAFAPNGRWLAAGKLDRSLLILDVETGTTLSSQEKLDELGQVMQVAFSADGQYVVAAGYSGAVMMWSIDAAGALTGERTLSRHGGRVESLAVSRTAPFLITGDADGELIWQSYASDTNQSRRQKSLARGAIAVHLPQNGLEAMATDGGSLARIDMKTADLVENRQLQRGSARAAAFSSDGSRLAVSAGYDIQVWDTATGNSLQTLHADHEMQWSVAFLRGGSRLISGGRGQATLWELENGQAITRFDLGGVLYIKTIAISPDATLLASIPASSGQTLSVLRIPE